LSITLLVGSLLAHVARCGQKFLSHSQESRRATSVVTQELGGNTFLGSVVFLSLTWQSVCTLQSNRLPDRLQKNRFSVADKMAHFLNKYRTALSSPCLASISAHVTHRAWLAWPCRAHTDMTNMSSSMQKKWATCHWVTHGDENKEWQRNLAQDALCPLPWLMGQAMHPNMMKITVSKASLRCCLGIWNNEPSISLEYMPWRKARDISVVMADDSGERIDG
jgi:hypothetical protein